MEHGVTYINEYECILNSLTVEGKAKLNVNQTEYHIGNPKLPSGLGLLKVLIRESHLDSNATSGMISTKLANLETYLMEMGNDIGKFNGHVQMLLDSLNRRGETTLDGLMSHNIHHCL